MTDSCKITLRKGAALAIALTILGWARPASGEVAVSIEAIDAPTSAAPFGQARLTIDNDSDVLIESVRLQDRRGGPMMVYHTPVAPRTKLTMPVRLLVSSVHQSIAVRTAAGEFDVELTWPDEAAEQSQAMLFDADAVELFSRSLPVWPRGLLQSTFLATVACCAGLSSLIFIRRGWLRLIVLAVAVAAMTVAAASILPGAAETVVRIDSPENSLVILKARRTATWATSSVELAPVYSSRSQMADDSMVIDSVAGTSVEIRPAEVRVFRRTGGQTGN